MTDQMLSTLQAKHAIEMHNWPNLVVDSIVFLDQGEDNVVFLVNNHVIFRFAKHAQADFWLQHENLILPALHKKLNINVPCPIYFGKPTIWNQFHFHGYEKLDGVALFKVNLTHDTMEQLVITLAQNLQKLHSIKKIEALSMGALPQVYDKTKFDIVWPMLKQRIEQLKKYNVLDLDDDFIATLADQACKVVFDQNLACLVHGDLDMRHLLIQDQKLTGIIDWGDSGINHPVIDLMIVYNIIPVKFHDLFFQCYGDVSDQIKLYAQFLTLHRMVTLMNNAHELGDTAMFDMAKRAYQRLKNLKKI